MTRTVRQARLDDHEDVTAFTEDTWSERDGEDYIPRIFPQWVEDNGPTQHTAVATVDGQPVGICQARVLADDEGWLQGMRVDPDHRGEGHGSAMLAYLMDWLRDQGVTAARNMVFGWNTMGMGQARAGGFDPQTACRWARPDPEAVDVSDSVVEDADAAWRYWTHSEARPALDGLALADDESWAVTELTRSRFESLVEEGRVLAVVEERTRAMTVRYDLREHDEELVADYAVAAWEDANAAAALFDAIRADAEAVGADATRVCIPETTRHVSDVALTRSGISERPVYIFSADLTGR